MNNRIKVLLFAFILSLGMIGCQGKDAEEKTEQKSEEQVDNASQKAKGIYITYQVISDEEINAEMMNDTVYKLQKRVELYAVDASVYQEGVDCIKVEIPGAEDADLVLQDLGRKGELYFISETAEDGSINYTGTGSPEESDAYETIWNLEKTIEELEKEGSVRLKGSDVKDAQAKYYQDSMGIGNDVVELVLTEDGSKKFEEATKYAYERGETIAIYYDGEFISVPKVTAVISGELAIIEGLADIEEAERLASVIRIGTLKCDLKMTSVEVIGDK